MQLIRGTSASVDPMSSLLAAWVSSPAWPAAPWMLNVPSGGNSEMGSPLEPTFQSMQIKSNGPLPFLGLFRTSHVLQKTKQSDAQLRTRRRLKLKVLLSFSCSCLPTFINIHQHSSTCSIKINFICLVSCPLSRCSSLWIRTGAAQWTQCCSFTPSWFNCQPVYPISLSYKSLCVFPSNLFLFKPFLNVH